MKLSFALRFLLLIFTLLPLTGQDAYLYGKQILSITEELNTFFPREENSENEKSLFAYLEDQFSQNEIPYHILDYSEAEAGHSFSRGYSARIDGEIDDSIIIAVPLNHKSFQSSQRNGSVNIASAIQLLRVFSQYKPPVSVEFLFLGAERGIDAKYPYGSQIFLRNYSVTRQTIAIYLDLSAPGETIILRNSSDNDMTPLWMIEDLSDLFLRKGLDFEIDSIESLAYQSGFESSPALLSTYLDYDVPIVLLESSPDSEITIPDDQWLNSFIETLMSFILDNQKGFTREWDRHYTTFKIHNQLFTLSEKTSLMALIGITAFLSMVLFLRSRNLHLNLKRFRNHLWTFPLLIFMVFLWLFLSTLIIEEISAFRDYPQFWEQNPLLFLLFKCFLSMFFYSAFLFIVRGISLSPSHHFYTYSAFTSIIISLLTVIVIDISLVPFFLWSLLFISLFMVSRKKMVKRLAIILSPLPILYMTYLIFREPYWEISRFLLLSRIEGNLFFTIIITPTLMLYSSLNHFIHRFHRHRRSFKNIFSIIALGVLTLLTFYHIIIIDSFSEENKQPVSVSEIIDYQTSTRNIQLTSPVPLGDLSLKIDEQIMSLQDVGREAQINAAMPENMIQITKEGSSFLDRLSLTYVIDVLGTPDEIAIELFSDESMIIFDSNYPSENSADGKSLLFHIGKNPTLPLELKFIIPVSLSPEMKIQLQYSDFPYDFQIPQSRFQLHKTMSVTQLIPWD